MHPLILIFYAFQAPITLSKIPFNFALASYCTVNQPLSKEHQSEIRDMQIPASASFSKLCLPFWPWPLSWHLLFIDMEQQVSWFAFCCCGKYHDANQPWGGKGWFCLEIIVCHWRKQRQELIEGSKGRNSGQEPQGSCAYWPVPFGLFNYLSYLAHTHLPRNGAAYRGLGPATSINN